MRASKDMTHTMAEYSTPVSRSRACFSCGSPRTSIFYEVENVPVNSCLLIEDREDAVNFPCGQLKLTFCESCGFIFNAAFDPNSLEYSGTYEETQGFSPRFQEFAHNLAQRLIERHQLRGKDVLEIGCGKGEFLALLCELGDNRGVGIDPAYVEGRLPAEATAHASFIQDFYSPAYGDLTGDFIVCRHTLEHIQPTREMVELVWRSAQERPDTVVFFEVPDVSRVLKELAFWDIYYEHCSYFSLGSLARLFRSCGFDLVDLTADFDNQYLLIEGRVSGGTTTSFFDEEEDLEDLAALVEHFKIGLAGKLESWRDDLRRIRERGQKAVLWGAGSKAVSYLTTLGEVNEIEYLVDVNPFKHEKFIAGTGHKVVSPEFLRHYRPDVVIVMNPIYRQEVKRDLEAMGLRPDLVAL
jgi:SAM-dependent methyltransferase